MKFHVIPVYWSALLLLLGFPISFIEYTNPFKYFFSSIAYTFCLQNVFSSLVPLHRVKFLTNMQSAISNCCEVDLVTFNEEILNGICEH